ncbi:MAG TPA: hypothetical protein PL071_10415 [Nitrosomonas sp.]|nr:hypothetical protein [Nitrosomonas sp.]
MRKIILLLSLLTAVANAQFDTRAIETKVINGVFGYRNLITNPSCKRNVAGITGSSVAAVRNTTTALDGITDCTWNPTATSQTLTYAYDSLPAGLKGQNCEARILYLGDASLVKANVQINSVNVASDLQLTNSGTNAAVASINYPCGDGSTATTLVLTSTGDAANVQYAVYGGQAINLNSGSQVTPWVAYTPTVQGFGTLTNVSVFYRIVGGNIEIQGKFQAGTVTASEGRIYLPTGYTSADTNRIATIQAVGHWWQANPTVAPGAILIEPSVTYVTLGSGSSSNNSFTKLNGSGVSASNELVGFFASVPLSGQGIGTTISLNAGPASWSGYHATDCAWTTSSSSFADPGADASCTFTERTNRNFGTVTSAGSKLPGIVFTPPSTGRYYICALAQASNDTSSNYSAYSMTDGTTEIAQGSSRYPNIISTPICGIYNAASVASTTIKLQLKSIAGGNAIIDGSRSNAIEWSIYSLDQAFPAPVLVGSITSNSTGAERLERAAVTSTCSASPCTIASQSGSWLTNITRASTGNYSINFAAGMFSAAPTCNIIANGLIATINTNPTTSAVVIDTKNTAGTSTDAQFFVQCMGPR